MESLFAKHSQEQHADFQRRVEYVIRTRAVYKRLRDMTTDTSVKRKFEDLIAFAKWEETPRSRHYLGSLLKNLVYTGLMTGEESDTFKTWHELCAQGENRADEWLSVEDMKELVSDDDVMADYLPVASPISGGAYLIPIDDVWYSVVEKRCYKKSDILQWVMTLSQTITWPSTPFRNPLTVAELFSMGADPFNTNRWVKDNPVTKKDKSDDRNEIIAAATNAAASKEDGLKYLKTLGIIRLPILQRIFRGHTNWVASVAFSPNGAQIVSGSADKSIRVWDVKTGQEIQQFNGHNKIIMSVAFSPDGKQIVSGSADTTIRLWNVTSGRTIQQFNRHTWTVTSVAFSPNGKQIVSGSYDKTIRLWDVKTGQELRQFNGHVHWVRSVAFSPLGRTIVSGSEDKTIILWNIETGNKIQQFNGHIAGIISVAFSLDGKQILSGSESGTFRSWNVETGKEIRQFSRHNEDVESVAFSPDGKQIVSGSYDSTIRLWNVETGHEIRQINTHGDGVLSLAFSSDGTQIVSGSREGTIRLWNVVE